MRCPGVGQPLLEEAGSTLHTRQVDAGGDREETSPAVPSRRRPQHPLCIRGRFGIAFEILEPVGPAAEDLQGPGVIAPNRASKSGGRAVVSATIDRDLAAARRFVEGVLGGAAREASTELVHPDIVVDSGIKPVDGPIRGAEEHGRMLGATLGAAFSGGATTIDDIAPLVDGRVIVRFTATAENTAPLNGIAATGRNFTFKEVHLMRFEEGTPVENWVGALNLLMFEMWQSPVIAPALPGGSHR